MPTTRASKSGKRSDGRRHRGRAAENLVAKYLKRKGYRIIGRNVVFPKIGELDIVAWQGEVLCFVEVRSRLDDRFGRPYTSIGRTKQRKLITLATLYLSRLDEEPPARFDIASVTWRPKPAIEYIENAFEDS